MSSYKEIDGYLADLPLGPIKLIDIVKHIMSIQSKKHKTQLLLSKQDVDSYYLEHCAVMKNGERYNLKDVWVDISYQRYLRLKKIYDHLGIKDVFTGAVIGFDPMLAGSVDFAVRADGRVFVWDGFRRCILALLKGINNIPANIFYHPDGVSDTDAQRKEAHAFSHRNSAMEPMKSEELFKAGIITKDPNYLKVKQVLVDCKLDILKVNYGQATLGAYTEFEKLVLNHPYGTDANPTGGVEYIIEASQLIQNAWGSGIGANVGGFMVAGLSYYLFKNEVEGNSLRGTYYLDPETIEEKLEEFAKSKNGTQSSLTKDRLHSKPKETVAWRIATKVMKFEEPVASVFLGFDTDEAAVLGASNGV